MSLAGLESKLSQGAGKRGKASPRVSPARLRLGAGASHPLPLPGSVLRRPGSVQAEAAPSTRPVPGQCRLHCGVGTLAAPRPPGSKLPAACVTSGAGFVQGVWEPLSPTCTGLQLPAPVAGEPRSPGPQRRRVASTSGFPLGRCSASGDFGQGRIGSPAGRGESLALSPSPLPASLLPSSSPAPHLQNPWPFSVPRKQALTRLPGPISRSQASALCLRPSVCLSVCLCVCLSCSWWRDSGRRWQEEGPGGVGPRQGQMLPPTCVVSGLSPAK